MAARRPLPLGHAVDHLAGARRVVERAFPRQHEVMVGHAAARPTASATRSTPGGPSHREDPEAQAAGRTGPGCRRAAVRREPSTGGDHELVEDAVDGEQVCVRQSLLRPEGLGRTEQAQQRNVHIGGATSVTPRPARGLRQVHLGDVAQPGRSGVQRDVGRRAERGQEPRSPVVGSASAQPDDHVRRSGGDRIAHGHADAGSDAFHGSGWSRSGCPQTEPIRRRPFRPDSMTVSERSCPSISFARAFLSEPRSPVGHRDGHHVVRSVPGPALAMARPPASPSASRRICRARPGCASERQSALFLSSGEQDAGGDAFHGRPQLVDRRERRREPDVPVVRVLAVRERRACRRQGDAGLLGELDDPGGRALRRRRG